MSVIQWPPVSGGGGITKYPNLAGFPGSASVGDLGIAEDTQLIYAWNGTAWLPIKATPEGSAGGELTGTYPNPTVVASTTTSNNSLVRRDASGNIQGATFNASGATASRAAILDASKNLASSTVTDTELGYVSGVTSAIQTQIDSKEPTITTLPISKGGTNSSTALNNNRVIISSGGKIAEQTAITASRALASDASGLPVASNTTATELGYVSGVTSALQTQLDAKATYASMLVSNTKYVAKNGNDTTGDGSFAKPYLTIGAALASITDASPTKRYVVLVQPGRYTENISLKANIFIQGANLETVRLDGTVNFDSSMSGTADNRTGCSNCIIIGAVDLNWSTVTSGAGKIYFQNCSFTSTVNLYGYNNPIAQGQFWSCSFFGTFTNSGINIAVHANNIHFAGITLTQHPTASMATILIASGGALNGTMNIVTTVNNFSRRCALFAYNFFMTGLTIDGASSYADVTQSSVPSAGPTILNGGNIVYVNQASANQTLSNLSFPTAVNNPIMPATSNATNFGDWNKQWFWSFAYVHASTGTDCYLISYGPAYGPDTIGRNIGIFADGAGLATNINGGDITLGTAAVSGTGVRGQILLDARQVDVNSTKIVNVADGSASKDAVNKSQLDTKEPTITTLPIAKGGTNSSTVLNNNRVMISSGGAIVETAAITTKRALESDSFGLPVASTVTSNELSYVSGVTSSIQTQLNGKEPTITTVPISKGGTNSNTALNNNRIMISSSGAIVETAAITASRALASDASGLPVASATTSTELGYVSGVTSSIQTQLNGKEPTITTLSATKGGLGTDASAFTGVVKSSSGVFSASAIVDADISASAGIVDTKLATISTAGKVSNSATTATSSRGNSTIVARDGVGKFEANEVNVYNATLENDGAGGSGSTTYYAGTAPSSPAANYLKLYFKSDQKLYKKNSSGTETEIGSGAVFSSLVSVSSNVTLTAGALHLVDTSAARSLTLPAAASLLVVTVKDSTGSAATNNITITPASGTIDGAASFTIDAAYMSVMIVSDGTNWFVV